MWPPAAAAAQCPTTQAHVYMQKWPGPAKELAGKTECCMHPHPSRAISHSQAGPKLKKVHMRAGYPASAPADHPPSTHTPLPHPTIHPRPHLLPYRTHIPSPQKRPRGGPRGAAHTPQPHPRYGRAVAPVAAAAPHAPAGQARAPPSCPPSISMPSSPSWRSVVWCDLVERGVGGVQK